MSYRVGSISLAAAVAAVVVAQAQDWMSDADLTAAFAGRTIEGHYETGARFTEVYLASGRLDYRDARGVLQGRWLVVNRTFCTLYDLSPTGGCYRVRQVGENCFEFYYLTRDEQAAAQPPTRASSWTARAWRTGERATCREIPAV